MTGSSSNTTMTDAQKQQVWDDFRAGRPTRVPMILETNPRMVIMTPEWNREGYSFEQTFEDPKAHVMVSLLHQLYCRQVLGPHCDYPSELPEVWTAGIYAGNLLEAALLGAEVFFEPGQVPDTHPWVTDANKHAVFDLDIEHPLDHPFCQRWLAFWREMEKVCADLTFEGRPVTLAPWAPCGSDGPITVAMNLRGPEFMFDMADDTDYADRLLEFITRAAIIRRQAFWDYWGDQVGRGNWMADDSCQMISAGMYERQVLKHHQAFYEAGPAEAERNMHMCGNATHLFPILHEQARVMAFDTGFPVDHGDLREKLGDDVLICGGPQVALLLEGTPQEVFNRSRDILQSGVMRGGRFIFREGNNLPPGVPNENLAAMYQACLTFGKY